MSLQATLWMNKNAKTKLKAEAWKRYNLLTQGFSNFLATLTIFFVTIWWPLRHLATLFDVKHLVKLLDFLVILSEKFLILNLNIWRPFYKFGDPKKGSQSIVWELMRWPTSNPKSPMHCFDIGIFYLSWHERQLEVKTLRQGIKTY